jgi:TPR repeat protein
MGLAQDYGQAFEWSRKAADQGIALAQFSVARLYLEGNGVAQSYPQALEWTLKAANQGLAEAQFTAAILYAEGPAGVPKDGEQAYMWADLAVQRFSRQEEDRRIVAAKDRDLMGAQLTGDQLHRAKEMEANWVRSHP